MLWNWCTFLQRVLEHGLVAYCVWGDKHLLRTLKIPLPGDTGNRGVNFIPPHKHNRKEAVLLLFPNFSLCTPLPQTLPVPCSCVCSHSEHCGSTYPFFFMPLLPFLWSPRKKEGEERKDQTLKTHPRPAGVSPKKLWYLILTIWTFSCLFLDSSDILGIKRAFSLSIHMASYGLPKQRVPLKSI